MIAKRSCYYRWSDWWRRFVKIRVDINTYLVRKDGFVNSRYVLDQWRQFYKYKDSFINRTHERQDTNINISVTSTWLISSRSWRFYPNLASWLLVFIVQNLGFFRLIILFCTFLHVKVSVSVSKQIELFIKYFWWKDVFTFKMFLKKTYLLHLDSVRWL